MEKSTAAEGQQRMVVVKNWHVVLTLAAWGFTMLWNYAGLYARADELTRRVHDLEEQRVTKEQFNTFREDLFHQLDAWEKKAELDRSVQQLMPRTRQD